MKKIISIILVLMMVLGLCACGAGGGNDTVATFQVGYAKGNITPSMLGLPMGGYGNAAFRLSTGYLDYTYTTVIALSDETGETVLLISNDVIRMPEKWVDASRQQITEATGIPGDHIMIAATHTHSSVDVGNNQLTVSDPYYINDYSKALVKAAQDALADLSPATIQTGKGNIDRMNFVRHYLMSDGSYAGDNHGTFDGLEIVDHATENDDQFQLIRFNRAAEDKKDVLLMNWQGHPCMTGGKDSTVLSADYIGTVRDYVEQNAGVDFIYFTGAAGNLNVSSRISGEALTTDVKEYGQIMGDKVIEVLGSDMKDVNSGKLMTKQTIYTANIDHTEDHLLEIAKPVQELYKSTGDRTAANNLARSNGLNSVYHANSIVSRASQKESASFEVDQVAVGDISFVTAPYEMFDTQGMYIKENTPFDTTIVMTLCNGSNSYFASEFAFEYGCYEVDNHRFVKGTAEAIAELHVNELKALHEQMNAQ